MKRGYWHLRGAKFLLGISIFLIPSITLAHVTGASFNQVVGPYLVDIGYNPVYPEINSKVGFDFRLWEASSTTNIVDFDDVFVQIKEDDTILLSTTTKKEDIFYPSLVFIPQKAGKLSMYVRYELNGQKVTETTMPLMVVDPNDVSGLLETVAIIVGLVAVSFFSYWGYMRFKARKTEI